MYRKNHHWHRAAAFVLFVGLGFVPSLAEAQRWELQRHHPATSQREDYLTVESGMSYLPFNIDVGLFTHYSQDSLVGTIDDEDIVVFENQLLTHLLFSYSPIERLRLAVDMPFYLLQNVNDVALSNTEGTLDGAGLGDLRITPKLTLFGRLGGTDDPLRREGAAMALLVPLSIPTGDSDRFQSESFRVEPRLAIDWANRHGWGVAVNAGYLIREDTVLGFLTIADMVTYGLGVRIPISQDTVSFLIDANGGVTPSDVNIDTSPMEGLGALRFYLGDFTTTVGGGLGTVPGYGTPLFRAFLGFAYSPTVYDPEEEIIEAPPSDRDGDGYLDEEDGCPDEPEDFDGFEDDDGCPDPDNDQDGIPDTNDDCPNAPEDFDDFEDADGCPDPDNDNDRIFDDSDSCPLEPETYNDYEDNDGCPDVGDITDIVYFNFDDATIRSTENRLIRELAELLRDNPELREIRLEGHACSIGTDAYNLALSERRARGVRRALEREGVDVSRLTIIGYGEARPAQSNDTDRGRIANRRVEFQVMERDP